MWSLCFPILSYKKLILIMNKTKWNKIKSAFRKNYNNQAIKRASNITANYKIQTFKFRAKKGIVDLAHVSCTKASPIFSGWKICIHHWSLLSGIHTESAIAGYWLGSVMNHNRSEGKFLWFPPTNPSQENGKSPKFWNNHYKMSKTLHILKHEC